MRPRPPRPTPRFSQPPRALSSRLISSRSVRHRLQFMSDSEDDDTGDRVKSPSTSRMRDKQGDQMRASSEEEVLAHATTGTRDHREPTIAIINSSDHSEKEEESEGEKEAETEENRVPEDASDDEDQCKSPQGPESDEEKTRHGSPPVAGADTPKDEKEEPSNATIGQASPAQRPTECPNPLKQSAHPHQAIPPEFAQSEDEDDDEKFAPHLLFSQSHTLAASQVRRQLASELSVKYHEGEEEQTVVKEESPITFPDPLPTGLAPKRWTPSDGYIIIESSPEPQMPQKGIV